MVPSVVSVALLACLLANCLFLTITHFFLTTPASGPNMSLSVASDLCASLYR